MSHAAAPPNLLLLVIFTRPGAANNAGVT